MKNANKKQYMNPERPFISNPNFRYKDIILKDNYDDYFMNESFEIFYSFNNNNEIYIISPGKQNEIRIIRLKDKKIIKTITGHTASVIYVRHFFNKNTKIDYLLSIDENKKLYVWDLSNYNLKQSISLNYQVIKSALLIFDKKTDYIITSSANKSILPEDAAKIYSLNDSSFIRDIPSSNNYGINYLLSWYNASDKKSYIISFCIGRIVITDLNSEDVYAELKSKVQFEIELSYHNGFIYEKNEYLCSLSEGCYINFWNLNNKTLINSIHFGDSRMNIMLKWSNKYIIISDKFTKSFNVIDIDSKRIITTIEGKYKSFVKIFKKIVHPTYGECLLICDHDGFIRLWTSSNIFSI